MAKRLAYIFQNTQILAQQMKSLSPSSKRRNEGCAQLIFDIATSWLIRQDGDSLTDRF
jgi:hypothetical protein